VGAPSLDRTKGTALYRLHKPQELLFVVLTLLAYGSPIQAIVAALGLDERTVTRWQKEAGLQCWRVHEHLVQAGNVELSQVQADELRVRVVGGVMWLAAALEVKSRLWLGGVVRVHRDRQLIRALLWRVKACGSVARILFYAPTVWLARPSRPSSSSGKLCAREEWVGPSSSCLMG
jgi:transposase-like protein